MHKIKLLSWRIKAEVEAEDLMIEKSMVGHNQDIDLSSRKLENASIVGKKEIADIGIRNKIKENTKRMIVRKILQLL